MSATPVRISRLVPLLLAAAAVAAAEDDGSEIVRDFNHYFIEAPNQKERVFGSTFLGVPISQNPADMWMMQELVTELAPDVIIETGTWRGGAALYLAMILEAVNPNGKVITIDIFQQAKAGIEALPYGSPMRKTAERIFRDRITAIQSNSVDPKLVESLVIMTKGKNVLVTLDSCHNSAHVLKELELYSKLVSPGSYLIVQDTFIDQKPEWVEQWARCPGYDEVGGPALAVEKFLKTNSSFEVDTSKEKYFLTYYPSGFLRRVR